MNRNRRRFAVVGVLVLALSVGLGAGAAEAKKKKKKKKIGGTVEITKTVGAAIPDAVGAVDGELFSTIDVGGKKFKKTRIRDANVSITTLGVAGATPAADLVAMVSSPNGSTSFLFFAVGGVSIGPLTLDDESPLILNPAAGPAPNSVTLAAPYIGSAQPQGFGFGNNCLCVMDNGGVTGTWTLRVFDFTPGETSILGSWGIKVAAGKPFKT